jgi:hypothetical protein
VPRNDFVTTWGREAAAAPAITRIETGKKKKRTAAAMRPYFTP